jgi:hypothetical protein
MLATLAPLPRSGDREVVADMFDFRNITVGRAFNRSNISWR